MLMWASFACLLLAPLMAMRVSAEVRWDVSDFLAFALILGAVGLATECAVRLTKAGALRYALVLASFIAGGLVWADGAVGIF
ncbi:MAG: hypothetical protein ABW039_02115 [Sphingobium sp.]